MDGILLIDKDKNCTSRDVVNIISKSLKTKKVGHFGTLDPLATGLLVVGVGKYTKFQAVLDNETKKYEVEVLLGKSTDTYDITGNVLKEEKFNVSFEELKENLLFFEKRYLQEVPIYSSVKVKGKKLYEYARNNEIIELPKKEIEIFNIENVSLDKNILIFTALVSKGTYIRSLINDLSIRINIPMCLNNLRRTKCGVFDIKDSFKIEEIENQKYKFYNIESILRYKTVAIPKDLEKIILNGGLVNNSFDEDKIIFTKNKKNIVLYETYKDNKMKPIFFF